VADLTQRRAPKAIALDDEATWPNELLRLLEAETQALRAYEGERTRIDRLREHNVIERYRPSPNPQRARREQTLAAVNSLLLEAALVGYHCTRLDEYEIASILRHGLQPLSRELVINRIRRQESAGALSADVVERLLMNHRARDGLGRDGLGLEYRTGKLWFVFTVAPLQEELGVSRLFTSWGGEAILLVSRGHFGRWTRPASDRCAMHRRGSGSGARHRDVLHRRGTCDAVLPPSSWNRDGSRFRNGGLCSRTGRR